MKKIKALGLLSGGLDSTIAVRIMLDLKFEVTVLNFVSPFCTCTSKNAGCQNEAVKISKEFSIPIKLIYLGQEYIDMIKNPQYGYGKNINPCLDCRIMMFKNAKKIMGEIGASFIFTGEVVGQRPMSQRRDTIHLIERESGLKGLILRPLSAKLLNPTVAEKDGIIDRNLLLNLSGRSRKPQIKMASDYGINSYSCPSGGCLLTEKNFANRMRDLINFSESPSVEDARLLRIGRHIRISDECKVIVGRDKTENERLINLLKEKDYSFYSKTVKGPYAISKGLLKPQTAKLICQIVAHYCKAPKDTKISVSYRQNNSNFVTLDVLALNEDKLKKMLI